MLKKLKKSLFNKNVIFILIGFITFMIFNYGYEATSTNEFCESCHVHPQAIESWKIGPHVYNESGVKVNCVDCHLPPSGFDRFSAKVTTGLRDVYGYVFKDSSDFNWEQMSQRESAEKHVYQSGCLKCHQNLFPPKLSRKGEDAHLYYDQNKEKIRCINCHLQTGHFHEKSEIETEEKINKEIYTKSAEIDTFKNFIETLPGSKIDFEMIAIPDGKFLMGSPDDEEYREKDEGPQVEVSLSKYFIGKTEVTWDEYNLFLVETGTEGRTEDQVENLKNNNSVDGISGPTPPYGNPGQGWGRGSRPAITMTHYAAQKYCEWLTIKTGKKYRLPTEAEWEYACRGNSNGAYFFSGKPSDYSSENFWNSFFGVDTTIINSFVIYNQNSNNKTGLPESKNPNPFGLLNTLGNVKEFCSDYYKEDIYQSYYNKVIQNPIGPASGKEHVIKGGSYKSDASKLRIASRDYTRHDAWLVTDPQIPKSLWWYSDCKDVGFRVVCEFNE
ncbi:MAG: SUMF1/EgtB/PvdO family nonheme iron enzyme [Ignavibacteriales bacterium]|nr:SUMF1/EgtB/PvdO family nonheme iron enzyme [Ignavibacteriales bacterium]